MRSGRGVKPTHPSVEILYSKHGPTYVYINIYICRSAMTANVASLICGLTEVYATVPQQAATDGGLTRHVRTVNNKRGARWSCSRPLSTALLFMPLPLAPLSRATQFYSPYGLGPRASEPFIITADDQRMALRWFGLCSAYYSFMSRQYISSARASLT